MIEGLRHGCEEYLCSCISKENVLYLFQLAGRVLIVFLIIVQTLSNLCFYEKNALILSLLPTDLLLKLVIWVGISTDYLQTVSKNYPPSCNMKLYNTLKNGQLY